MHIRQTMIRQINSLAENSDQRIVIGIAGPPASGKSTFVGALMAELGSAVIVPMDGFHLDNSILERRGQLSRKGSAQTFDAFGYYQLLKQIQHAEHTLYAPSFDREADLSRGAAIEILPEHRIVLAEGNYLLMNQAPWGAFKALFDITIFLNVPIGMLRKRLIQRWLDHGYDQESAVKRAESNDLANARGIIEHSLPADYAINNY